MAKTAHLQPEDVQPHVGYGERQMRILAILISIRNMSNLDTLQDWMALDQSQEQWGV